MQGTHFIGGLLVSAAAAGFAMSKEGRECTKKLKENIGKLRDVTKDDFDELVATLVDEYAKKKEINDDSKKKVVKALKSKWDEIKVKFEPDQSA